LIACAIPLPKKETICYKEQQQQQANLTRSKLSIFIEKNKFFAFVVRHFQAAARSKQEEEAFHSSVPVRASRLSKIIHSSLINHSHYKLRAERHVKCVGTL